MSRRQAGQSLKDAGIVARQFPETVFNLRIGPDYKRNGQKAPSGPPIFSPIAMDVFRTERKLDHVATFLDLPPIPADRNRVVSGVPPLFIVNVQLPSYDPPNPLWGAVRDEGPGYVVVMYLLIQPETQSALENIDTAPPAYRLLKDFIEKDELRVRFKAMANFLNGHECNLGFALRKLLSEYNMKPILTRPQHRFYTDSRTYFETVIDVHQFSYICRRGLSSMRPMISTMVWDVGLTIEGHSDEELPENILGVAYMSHVDLDKDGETLDLDQARAAFEAAGGREVRIHVSQPAVEDVPPPPGAGTPQRLSDLAAAPVDFSSFSSPPSPRTSRVRVSVPAVEPDLAASVAAKLSLATTQVAALARDGDDSDEEFHDVDEDFYDAES